MFGLRGTEDLPAPDSDELGPELQWFRLPLPDREDQDADELAAAEDSPLRVTS